MITGASGTLAYQNHSEADQCDIPHCWKGGLVPGKQPMSLQLTSGSGEQTFFEAALRPNRSWLNLTLLSYSYCITGISKPADYTEWTKQIHLKIICKSYYTKSYYTRSTENDGPMYSFWKISSHLTAWEKRKLVSEQLMCCLRCRPPI